MSKKVGLFLCPKGGGYANGIQNATLAKIDEAGEKLQNIGSSVENVGKKFLPVTAAASSNTYGRETHFIRDVYCTSGKKHAKICSG